MKCTYIKCFCACFCSPDTNRVATPETDEGYLKNHLLRGNSLRREFSEPEISHFNNEAIMDKNSSTLSVETEDFPRETQFVHTKAAYKVVEGPPLTPNPFRRAPKGFESVSDTRCTEGLRDNEKILCDVSTEAPIANNPAELLVSMPPQRQWYQMDGEKTSFLTEELFLASLENEGATTRLVQQITAIDQSNPCKLVTLSPPNDISGWGMPHETTEIKCAHDDLDIMDQLLLSQRLHKGVTDLHNNETTVGVHETSNNERPMSNSTIPKRSNMLGHHGANSHIENTGSSIITKNMVKVKVKSQVELDDNRMEDCLSKGPEAATSTRKRLLEPTISVHDTARISGQQSSSIRDQPSLCSEWHSTELEREREKRDSLARTRVSSHTESVAENFEDRGQNGASAMINQHNKSNLAQQPRPGNRKVNIPQKILKSVYERCDLERIRPPGYTVLCNAQPKVSAVKHSEDHIQTSIRASPLLWNAPTPLQPEHADVINPQSTFREQGNICRDNGSGNKENIGNGNEYADLCSQGSEEELNILASLERLDHKLAAINGKSLNNERNSLNSRQLSSKSTQSAPPVLIQRGAASSSLGKRNLVTGKPKNFPCNPPRPSVSFVSTRSILRRFYVKILQNLSLKMC